MESKEVDVMVEKQEEEMVEGMGVEKEVMRVVVVKEVKKEVEKEVDKEV